MVTAFLDNTVVSLPDTRNVTTSGSPPVRGVTLIYDDALDELHILLDAGPVQRHVEPVNRYLSKLVDTATGIPFGFMVESFLTHAVHEFSQLESVAKYLQLGNRPYKDPNLYRQDAPTRTSFPDLAWSDEAHDAIENIIEITGGTLEP